jgi:anti-anti-sigma factor
MVGLALARTELDGGLMVLAVKGSIHCGPEVNHLEAEVDQLITETRTRVILDLSGVVTMDSAAIGAVVRCLRKLKNAGGDLRLAAAPLLISRSLEQTKVNKIVATFGTVAEAAAGFPAKT